MDSQTKKYVTAEGSANRKGLTLKTPSFKLPSGDACDHGKVEWRNEIGLTERDAILSFLPFPQVYRGHCEEYKFAGSPHGPLTLWHQNGQKWVEMTYVNGWPHGTIRVWHENGTKAFEIGCIEGGRQGPFESVHPNGKIMEKGQFDHDQKVGDWKAWDDTGKPTFEGSYVDGKEDGEHRLWADGLAGTHFLSLVEHWNKGVMNGRWTWYKEFGGIIKVIDYVDGEAHLVGQ